MKYVLGSKVKLFLIVFAILALIGLFFFYFILDNDKVATNDPIETIHKAGLVIEKSPDALKNEAQLIVHGKIVGKSDVFQISPVGGGTPSNFSDYYLEPTETLRGEEKEQVTIRVEGGIFENTEIICENEPKFEIGQECLLFLYQPGMGGGFETEDDHYYVLGMEQGVYNMETNSLFTANMGDSIELNSLIEELNIANNPVIDGDYYRNQALQNMQGNVERGMMTQEEYDQAAAEMNQYAKIIE